jgi:hypothetical protein
MRLISFGCSLTFGHGLPDCHTPPNGPGNTPSKYAWPDLLSVHMNRKCINMSHPGASNKRIWKTIIDFEYQPTDVVFVLWSYVDRSSVIYKKHVHDIGPWMDDDISKNYYKNYSKHDALLQSQLYISHVNSFLKEKNITVYNMIITKYWKNVFTLNGNETPHIPLYIDDFRNYYSTGLDKSHPGQECHNVFANAISKYITTGQIDKMPLLEKIRRGIFKA